MIVGRWGVVCIRIGDVCGKFRKFLKIRIKIHTKIDRKVKK